MGRWAEDGATPCRAIAQPGVKASQMQLYVNGITVRVFPAALIDAHQGPVPLRCTGNRCARVTARLPAARIMPLALPRGTLPPMPTTPLLSFALCPRCLDVARKARSLRPAKARP